MKRKKPDSCFTSPPSAGFFTPIVAIHTQAANIQFFLRQYQGLKNSRKRLPCLHVTRSSGLTPEIDTQFYQNTKWGKWWYFPSTCITCAPFRFTWQAPFLASG
ncbi:hypothetical protein [Aquitalea pelogenes]|uniref:hypothetical protein n=1 Tax=Aquitalea pelogenes TaxID=1293573 RepID=UPI0035ADBCDB